MAKDDLRKPWGLSPAMVFECVAWNREGGWCRMMALENREIRIGREDRGPRPITRPV